MGSWLAHERNGQKSDWLKRFDPRFWTVDFPRPMMASVTTTAPDALRVDAIFYDRDALAGLIWWSEDRYDHPLLGYATVRDYRACTLRFRWRSEGVRGLDAVHGPTLTIEGRDAEGAPRAWYVRLWNYAEGSPEDAEIAIDFADVRGGFALGGEPVWAGDVDRMFVSLVPADYDPAGGALAAAAEAWVELSGIACDGSGSVLALGDVLVPPHRLRIAMGYDDAYNVTPERLLRNMVGLGYRAVINHYVGMSHYFRLDGGLVDAAAADPLNAACRAWHLDFAARAKALGFELILSLSYELFDAHCPEDWKQRAADGSPALTGWVPPSTLLSPCSADAMAYLQAVARSFVAIAQEAGQPVRFQVGEPWWWLDGDGNLCVHDAATLAACGGTAPDPEQAGALLAASTVALTAAVRAVAADAETLLLAYLPTVLKRPELVPALLPSGWASPAFDVLQLEDYEWATAGNVGASARGVALATERLGYPVGEQHYLSGFVLRPEDSSQWREIAAAIDAARARGVDEVFVWALPQVIRDGFTWFELTGEGGVDAFADVVFPIDIGREAMVEATTSTAIAAGAGGTEQRNAEWAEARLRFDAGPGVRSDADLAALIAFFRARRGPAQAFRFRDPYDDASGAGGAVTPLDQAIGIGDGARTDFALVKSYGETERRITRPVAGSVRVSVDGVEVGDWSLDGAGLVRFDEPPADGAEVRAGFRFDVPVRFAEDRLSVGRATFLAGEAPSVPLIEVREA